MAKINILDQLTIDKIAAGEVVERPRSVVKELVENSIDAMSTQITVEIKDGGTSLIRITDNGSGIEKSQVRTAFLRHATSKIKSALDLVTVSSLGFRGEALSSISAVSKVELITKTARDLTGVRYEIDGGREKTFEEIGCPEGTTFIVRELFFNTPARQKFLKSAKTEGTYISDLIEKLAMSHPDISFKLIVNGGTKLYTTGNGNLKEIIYQIYGREVSKQLLEIEKENPYMKLHGYIGKPVLSRGNRSFENYFINNRFIKSPVVSRGIEEGYHTYTMVHKYPFCAFYMDVNPELIDVNVHPAKMELRFHHEKEVYDALVMDIRETLKNMELIPKVYLTKDTNSLNQDKKIRGPEPFEQNRIRNQEIVRETNSYHENNIENKKPQAINMPKPTVAEPIQVAKEAPPQIAISQEQLHFKNDILEENVTAQFLSEIAKPKRRIIGQLFSTYWLMEYENKFFIMDQHAAHEKVLYERFLKNYKEKKVCTQQIMPTVVLDLSTAEKEVLEEHFDEFSKIGFEIEEFGKDSYCLRGVPTDFYAISKKELFLELLDDLVENSYGKTHDAITYYIATLGCKAAVKGNHNMKQAEIEALLDELMTLENPYNCPHGRPTLISFSKKEIERMFKRIQD